MTVPSSVAKSGPYDSNGVTDVFNYDFRIVDEAHLSVLLTSTTDEESTLTLATHYTVSGVGNQSGSINLTSAGLALAVSGTKITILRNPPFTQETDLQNQGPYLAQTVEDRFDLITMQVQTIKERSDRSIAIPASDEGTALDDLTEDLIRIADSADNIDTVAGIETEIGTVAGISAEVTTVSGISTDVQTVAARDADIGTVAARDADIGTVADRDIDIGTVSGIADDVSTVAGISGDVTTVAGISTDVSTVADNVSDITNFSDVYLGASATAPTTRTDGSALVAGDQYFDTAENKLKVWTGSAWIGGTGDVLSTNNGSDFEDPAATLANLGGTFTFDTLALAEAATIPAGIEWVKVDSTKATYNRVALDPGHPGAFQDASGAWFELAVDWVTPQMLGADISAGTSVTQEVLNAAEAALAIGAEGVRLTVGTYTIGPLGSASTGAVLDANYSGVRFVGAGRGLTFLKPTSNEVEMFAQDGAAGPIFEDLTFENPHGILQNQTDAGARTKFGGIAGLGNGANAAIRQYNGTGITIRRVKFKGFNTCLNYIGNFTNNQVLDGDVIIDDVEYEDYCFGALVEQPQNFIQGEIISSGCVGSIDDLGNTAPGHAVYVTDRSGAAPDTVQIGAFVAQNDHCSPIKVRKAKNLSIADGYNFYQCGKGVEIFNVEVGYVGAGTGSLSGAFTDNAAALELTDCGSVIVGDGSIFDIRDRDAWGVRVRTDLDNQSWHNAGVRVGHTRVIQNYSVENGRAPFIVEGQENFTMDLPTFDHPGSVAGARYPVDIRNCDRARINRPSHHVEGGGNPTDSGHLVSFDVDCVDCVVVYSSEDVDNTQAADAISDSGTGTRIVSMGSSASVSVLGFGFTRGGVTFNAYRRNLNEIGLAVNGVPALTISHQNAVRLDPRTDAPTTLGAGTLAYSNGAGTVANGWNASGAGLYRYDGGTSAWVFIG